MQNQTVTVVRRSTARTVPSLCMPPPISCRCFHVCVSVLVFVCLSLCLSVLSPTLHPGSYAVCFLLLCRDESPAAAVIHTHDSREKKCPICTSSHLSPDMELQTKVLKFRNTTHMPTEDTEGVLHTALPVN